MKHLPSVIKLEDSCCYSLYRLDLADSQEQLEAVTTGFIRAHVFLLYHLVMRKAWYWDCGFEFCSDRYKHMQTWLGSRGRVETNKEKINNTFTAWYSFSICWMVEFPVKEMNVYCDFGGYDFVKSDSWLPTFLRTIRQRLVSVRIVPFWRA
jgi:hypothetical protein